MTQIKLRRDTAANFTSKNPVLGVGEPAYETDTKKLKIGDGTTAYTQLAYFSAGGGGGGTTNITATLPLKIVDDVISLEVDGQTIQIVDGKLHANLDELGNEVNDLSGRVTAAEADILTKQDKLTAGDNITISVDNIISAAGGGGLEVKTATTANFNSSELLETGLYYISPGLTPQNAPVSYAVAAMLITMKWFSESSNQRIQQTWIGCEDLVANQIYTRYSKANGVMNSWVRVDSNKMASASALGTIKVGDGLSIATDGTLSASGGSTPTNMVTTDTEQTITGSKTFEGVLTFKGFTNWRGTYNNNCRLNLVDHLDGGASISVSNASSNNAMYGVGGGSSYVTYFQPAYGSTKFVLNNYEDGSSENGIAPIVEIAGNLQNKVNSTNYQILTQNNVTAGDNITVAKTDDGIQITSTAVTPVRYPIEVSDKSLLPSWYVLYNDGWCEQGGIAKSATTGVATVSLLKPYKSTNYTRLLTLGDRLDGAQWVIYPTNKTTTSFGASSPLTGYELGFDWETKGYIS